MSLPSGKVLHSALNIATIRRGTKLFRISYSAHPAPLYFNPDQSGRYNSPTSEYGVCYMADNIDTAFAESLGHSVATRYAPSQKKVIAESDLEEYHAYQLEVVATLHLGELCGSGLPRLNLDNGINTSPKPYTLPQQWSHWIHQHPNNLDGIRYHSRHLPNHRCEAFFDRCASKLSLRDLGSLINWSCPKTGKDIWDILIDHGWGVV